MMVSVITTLLNEEKNIGDLIESLIGQEGPYEFIIVDAESTDNTVNIIKRYIARGHDWIKLIVEPGSRGKCFNIGIDAAEGEVIAFMGGDCIASPGWISQIRNAMKGENAILVGKTVLIGHQPFKELERVELYHKGYDISYPGNNTSYSTELLRKVDGFDPYFITAEDIDLNARAVNMGAHILVDESVIIYHKVKDSFSTFIKQAFWNGFGRKQLTLKHGKLWQSYSFRQMVFQEVSFWKLFRLAIASGGYLFCKITSKLPDYPKGYHRLRTYIDAGGDS